MQEPQQQADAMECDNRDVVVVDPKESEEHEAKLAGLKQALAALRAVGKAQSAQDEILQDIETAERDWAKRHQPKAPWQRLVAVRRKVAKAKGKRQAKAAEVQKLEADLAELRDKCHTATEELAQFDETIKQFEQEEKVAPKAKMPLVCKGGRAGKGGKSKGKGGKAGKGGKGGTHCKGGKGGKDREGKFVDRAGGWG